jgi:hypothetical protein
VWNNGIDNQAPVVLLCRPRQSGELAAVLADPSGPINWPLLQAFAR